MVFENNLQMKHGPLTLMAFPCGTEKYTGLSAAACREKPDSQKDEPTWSLRSVAAAPASLKASQLVACFDSVAGQSSSGSTASRDAIICRENTFLKQSLASSWVSHDDVGCRQFEALFL